MFLSKFTAFEVGSGVGSCGFQRRFYENLQHFVWAPAVLRLGSGSFSLEIRSIFVWPPLGLALFS